MRDTLTLALCLLWARFGSVINSPVPSPSFFHAGLGETQTSANIASHRGRVSVPNLDYEDSLLTKLLTSGGNDIQSRANTFHLPSTLHPDSPSEAPESWSQALGITDPEILNTIDQKGRIVEGIDKVSKPGEVYQNHFEKVYGAITENLKEFAKTFPALDRHGELGNTPVLGRPYQMNLFGRFLGSRRRFEMTAIHIAAEREMTKVVKLANAQKGDLAATHYLKALNLLGEGRKLREEWIRLTGQDYDVYEGRVSIYKFARSEYQLDIFGVGDAQQIEARELAMAEKAADQAEKDVGQSTSQAQEQSASRNPVVRLLSSVASDVFQTLRMRTTSTPSTLTHGHNNGEENSITVSA